MLTPDDLCANDSTRIGTRSRAIVHLHCSKGTALTRPWLQHQIERADTFVPADRMTELSRQPIEPRPVLSGLKGVRSFAGLALPSKAAGWSSLLLGSVVNNQRITHHIAMVRTKYPKPAGFQTPSPPPPSTTPNQQRSSNRQRVLIASATQPSASAQSSFSSTSSNPRPYQLVSVRKLKSGRLYVCCTYW